MQERKISIVATTPRGGTGDGEIDLGYFDAISVDLTKVKIDGDVGRIGAGDGVDATPALKSLKVASIGAQGLASQGGAGSLQSRFDGDVGKLTVLRNVEDVTLGWDGRPGEVVIGGDLSATTFAVSGKFSPTDAAEAQAFTSFTVNGDVVCSRILAGFNSQVMGANADAGIGNVLVQGEWRGSDLVAGVRDATNDCFGRNDQLISGGDAGIVARIASVKLKGGASGFVGVGEHFGITAEKIAKLLVGGTRIPLTPEADDVLLDDVNGNFRAVDFT